MGRETTMPYNLHFSYLNASENKPSYLGWPKKDEATEYPELLSHPRTFLPTDINHLKKYFPYPPEIC